MPADENKNHNEPAYQSASANRWALRALRWLSLSDMSACRCETPPFDYRDFQSTPVGIDETNGRFAEVSIETCRHCGTKWLRYLVEYEAFSESGRWYRGRLTAEMEQALTPERAVAMLESLTWHFYGGSYFRTTGQKGVGPLCVDL